MIQKKSKPNSTRWFIERLKKFLGVPPVEMQDLSTITLSLYNIWNWKRFKRVLARHLHCGHQMWQGYVLLTLANRCLLLSYFPKQWKVTHVCILHKPGNPNAYLNYATILYTHTISPLFYNKLSSFFQIQSLCKLSRALCARNMETSFWSLLRV